MATKQQQNDSVDEEKAQAILSRRCSLFQNQSRDQSDTCAALQSCIYPTQGRQSEKLSTKSNKQIAITNITIDKNRNDISVTYTNAKQKKKRDLLETCGVLLLTIMFSYFCANGGKRNEFFWKFVGRVQETWIEIEWVHLDYFRVTFVFN